MTTTTPSPSSAKLRHGSSSGSKAMDGVTARGTRLPASARNDSLPPSQECRYATKNITGCYTYRTCQDCLAKEGCQIGISGYCEVADVRQQFDYHGAFNASLVLPAARTANATGLLGVQSWQFPASQLDYCLVNDTVCAECINQHYWQSPGASEDSRFCVGTKGCVCIANCNQDWNVIQCPSQKVSNDDDMQNSGEGITRAVLMVFGIIFGMVLLVVISLGVCCYSMHKKRHAQRENAPASLSVTAANRDLASVPYTVVKSGSSPRTRLQGI